MDRSAELERDTPRTDQQHSGYPSLACCRYVGPCSALAGVVIHHDSSLTIYQRNEGISHAHLDRLNTVLLQGFSAHHRHTDRSIYSYEMSTETLK